MDRYQKHVEKQIDTLESEALKSPLYAWSHGLSAIDYMPPILYITPTNVCTHACKICAHKSHTRKGVDENGVNQRGIMDWDRFSSIARQIPEGVSRIYLYKHGEPLVHKNFSKMSYYLREHINPDVELALSTNGNYLTDEHIETFFDNYNVVVLSIYSIKRETFKELHGKDTFDKVMKNYKHFHDLYAKKSGSKLKVYLNYVRQSGNSHESEEEVSEFFRKHFSYFHCAFHETFNFGGRIDEGNFEILENLDKSLFPSCVMPWSSFTILWDGWVSHCNVDVEEWFHGNGRVPESSIIDCINHDGLKEYRQAMANRDFDVLDKRHLYCGKCNWMFSLRFQSMNYLTLHTKKVAKRFKIPELQEDPILISSKEMLFEGLIDYLEGNLDGALKNIVFARETATTEKDKARAERWFRNCVDVIKMRKNLEIWENSFVNEGTSLRSIFQTTYLETIDGARKNRLDKNKF